MTNCETPLSDCIFCLEVYDGDQQIHEQTIKPVDFNRAIYDTTLDALRLRKTDQYNPLVDAARVEPVFPHGNSPRTSGFVVNAALPSGERHQREFAIDYFMSRALRTQTRMIRENKLGTDAKITYQLTAFFDDPIVKPTHSKLPISLEPPQFSVNLREGRYEEFGRWQPWDDPNDQDLRVVLVYDVLVQSVDEARNQPDQEFGGLLIGNLMQDVQTRDPFLAVNALVPGAGTTEASGTSVTFTPDTFAEAQKIIRLRGAGEIVVGWAHSHPFKLCRECPLPTPPECISKILFYSQDDVHLMERTFDQPFMVGLLAAVEPRIETAIGHLPVRLFGWRRGSVHQRGFHVVQMASESNVVETISSKSNEQQAVAKG